MKNKSILNWNEIWKKFDKWFDKNFDRSWIDQKKAIKRIVEKELKGE